jgi:hypothetical protein
MVGDALGLKVLDNQEDVGGELWAVVLGLDLGEGFDYLVRSVGRNALPTSPLSRRR